MSAFPDGVMIARISQSADEKELLTSKKKGSNADQDLEMDEDKMGQQGKLEVYFMNSQLRKYLRTGSREDLQSKHLETRNIRQYVF